VNNFFIECRRFHGCKGKPVNQAVSQNSTRNFLRDTKRSFKFFDALVGNARSVNKKVLGTIGGGEKYANTGIDATNDALLECAAWFQL
jgi:hypothetical protein